MSLSEVTPGEYEYKAKVGGVSITSPQPSYKFIWLGKPDLTQSRISPQAADGSLTSSVWVNKEDELSVVVKVCDACGRYPQKQNEAGLPIGLKFTGPENWELSARETDRSGAVKFSGIIFDKPGDYQIESLLLGDSFLITNVRGKPAPRVENFEIVQAISMPFSEQTSYLVENKETILRLFVKNRDTSNANVEVKLLLRRGDTQIGELHAHPVGGLRILQPRNSYNRLNLSHTYNFRLPPSLAKGAISIEVAQTPKEHPNDKEPRKGLTFHRRTLSVRYVLFEVNGNKLNPAEVAKANGLIQRVWPLSSLDYQPLDLVVRPVTRPPKEYTDANVGLKGELYTIFSAMSGPKPDQLIGFYAHPSKCQGSGNQIPTRRVNPDTGEQGPITVRRVDVTPARIEDIGLDTAGGWRLRQNDWEVMNQGRGNNDVWVSQFSWKLLFNRLPGSESGLNNLHERIVQPTPLLLIRGSVFRNGMANLEPIYPASSGLNPAPDGPYCLRLEDAAGQPLFNRCFSINEYDQNFQPLDPASFSETIPHPAGLAKVALMREGRVLTERRVSPNAPTVVINSPAVGEFWEGARTVQTQQFTVQFNDNVCFWASLNIAGFPAASFPGNWQVRVFYNNAPLFTDSFTISSGGVRITDRRMTGGPIPDQCAPPPAKSSFAPSDAQAYQWTLVAGAKIGDLVRWEFVQPNGTVYTTSDYTVAFNDSVCFWGGINIAGTRAATLPGNWQARVLYNGNPLVTENFTITAGAVSFSPDKQKPVPDALGGSGHPMPRRARP